MMVPENYFECQNKNISHFHVWPVPDIDAQPRINEELQLVIVVVHDGEVDQT